MDELVWNLGMLPKSTQWLEVLGFCHLCSYFKKGGWGHEKFGASSLLELLIAETQVFKNQMCILYVYWKPFTSSRSIQHSQDMRERSFRSNLQFLQRICEKHGERFVKEL